MTRFSIEYNKQILFLKIKVIYMLYFSIIISDIIKSFPDLSKITSLSFTTDSSITLARHLLDKIPKISRLELPYNYLLCLLKSPLFVKLYV